MSKGQWWHHNISVSRVLFPLNTLKVWYMVSFLHRVEISPCLDPGYRIQSKFNVSTEQELLLSKYLDKVLSLPINTFTGATPWGTWGSCLMCIMLSPSIIVPCIAFNAFIEYSSTIESLTVDTNEKRLIFESTLPNDLEKRKKMEKSYADWRTHTTGHYKLSQKQSRFYFSNNGVCPSCTCLSKMMNEIWRSKAQITWPVGYLTLLYFLEFYLYGYRSCVKNKTE